MSQSFPSHANIPTRPLGAGDLIDRAVRFYRRFFWTFVLIASPPVIVGTVVSIAWTAAGRGLFAQGPASEFETFFYYAFIWLGNVVIWLTEMVATLVVMGGASRNFVRHLLFGEAITFRETYRNVVGRLGGLTAASMMITTVLATLGIILFYFGLFVAAMLIAGIIYAIGEIFPFAGFIVSLAAGLAVGGVVLYLFFLVASGVAYVPQVMLVEGLGVFAAIGRSVSLAGGSARRLAALFIFSTVAAYSALAILYVPLGWYAAYAGVELVSFGGQPVPAWYEVAYNLIWQISFILLSPVWMIGLCLLYVDTRVRLEGYDLELMAAARLGEIPAVPSAYSNPLQPALGTTTPPASPGRSDSITSLNLR
jgi:hypothetical protein